MAAGAAKRQAQLRKQQQAELKKNSALGLKSSSTPNLRFPNYDKLNSQHTLTHGLKDTTYVTNNLQNELALCKEELKFLKEDLQVLILGTVKGVTSLILEECSLQDARVNAELHIIKTKLAECSRIARKVTGDNYAEKSVETQTEDSLEIVQLNPFTEVPPATKTNSLIPPPAKRKLQKTPIFHHKPDKTLFQKKTNEFPLTDITTKPSGTADILYSSSKEEETV